MDYAQRGEKAGTNGDYEQAIAGYTEAIRLDPDDAGFWFYRGYYCSKAGNNEQAIADCTEAIRLDPDDDRFWYTRGCCYSEAGNNEQAIADDTEAIRLDPDYADFWYTRGYHYSKAGNNEQAIADYTEAIRLKPDYFYAWNSRGWINYEAGNYAQAIKDAAEAIRLNPERPSAYDTRGCAYLESGEYDKAIADFDQAICLAPDDNGYRENRQKAADAKALFRVPQKEKIMTIEEALANVKNGESLSRIPLALRTGEVCLAAIKSDCKQLLYVPVQTFEMCAAAVKQHENALCYVDPEFRTGALIRAAGKEDEFDVDDDDGRFEYEERSPSGDETTYITVYGKGSGAPLVSAYNIVRRCIETNWDKNMPGWYDVWTASGKQGCFEMSIAPDSNSFTLSFWYDGDSAIKWEPLFFDCLYAAKDSGLPELFLVTGVDRSWQQVRSCVIGNAKGVFKTFRNWSFDVGQGEDEMYDSLDGFEKAVDKRRERWLAEGAGA